MTTANAKSSLLTTIIHSKLAPPRQIDGMVSRRALLAELQRHYKKTVVMLRAPSGYGKTTALTQLRQQLCIDDSTVAWCTLSDEENNPQDFFRYLYSAVKVAGLALSDEALEAFQQQAIDSKALIANLLNELLAQGEDIYLLLDNFQVISDADLLEAFAYLVDHAPDCLHLVLASTDQPALPWLQWQMHNQLEVIDAQALSFSLEEVKSLIALRTSSIVNKDDVLALYDFTQGWPAALQLATAAINSGSSVAQSIEQLQSSSLQDYFTHHHFDYLDTHCKQLLLTTALFPRFNHQLISHVTGQAVDEKTLQALAQKNIFLMPVTQQPGWYQYLSLYGDFLQQRARSCSAIDLENFYQRASQWCEANNYLTEAVCYALDSNSNSSGIDKKNSQLLEQCAFNMLLNGELENCLALLNRLSDQALQQSPALIVAKAWVLALSNQTEAAMALLEWIDDSERIDQHTREQIQIIKAICAIYCDDLATLSHEIQQWYENADREQPFSFAVGCNVLAMHLNYQGQYEQAREVLIQAKKWSEQERGLYSSYYSQCYIALSYVRQGYFKVAEPLYRSLLQRAERDCGPRSAPACTIASFYSEVLYEMGQFDALKTLLENREAIIDKVALPEAVLGTYVSQSRVYAFEEKFIEAKNALETMQLRAESNGQTRILAHCLAERVKLHLQLDEYRTASDLSKRIAKLAEGCSSAEGSLPAEGSLLADGTLPAEGSAQEELQLAKATADIRLMLFEGQWQQAHQLAQQQLQWLRESGQFHHIMQWELFCARTLSGLNRQQESMAILDDLLRQGEQLGLMRLFIDEWPYCIHYLEQPEANGLQSASKNYLQKMRKAFANKPLKGGEPNESSTVQALPAGEDPLVESLSRREIEILSLLEQGLQNKQIANSLNLSLDTIKWHLKNIYGKLNVPRRSKAVSKAKRLGVL